MRKEQFYALKLAPVTPGIQLSFTIPLEEDDGEEPPPPVPEPASLLLMGAGLMGLAAAAGVALRPSSKTFVGRAAFAHPRNRRGKALLSM
jgi:hypothetical protein